jgi:hypothetical protein
MGPTARPVEGRPRRGDADVLPIDSTGPGRLQP